ncbi:D-alanyl-D-alanine carboxypeptidase [Streptomyces sp. M19]
MLENVFHVSMENFEIHDGSGLSRANRIPARTVADMLDLLTDSRYQQLLKPIDEGLPVAGEEGSTLGPEWGRFDTPTPSAPSARSRPRRAP